MLLISVIIRMPSSPSLMPSKGKSCGSNGIQRALSHGSGRRKLGLTKPLHRRNCHRRGNSQRDYGKQSIHKVNLRNNQAARMAMAAARRSMRQRARQASLAARQTVAQTRAMTRRASRFAASFHILFSITYKRWSSSGAHASVGGTPRTETEASLLASVHPYERSGYSTS